jgi:linoleoyl-CoA desaturase
MRAASSMLDEGYLQLAARLKNGKWAQRPTRRLLFELAVHLTAMGVGGYLMVVLSSWPAVAASYLLFICGAIGVATHTHSSSHHTTSKSAWLDKALTYFGYTVIHGLSGGYWYHKHVVVHHPAPNVIGIDDDADLLPFFVLAEEDAAGATGLRRWYYRRLQFVLLPLALALNHLNIQFSGWRYLVQELRDPRARSTASFVDLGLLILHWALWVGVPLVFFSPLGVLAFNAARWIGVGYGMFIVFAPAHFPAEAVLADESQKRVDFVLRQTATTVNFRTGPIGRFLCSGVQYQIEHHLFPRISHVYYPELSPLVEQFCRERNYPYRTLGWGEALWKSLVAFYQLRPVVRNLETVRGQSEPVAADGNREREIGLPAGSAAVGS